MTGLESGGSNNQVNSKDVQEEASRYEDEINLREYIQVIIKRRKLVISIFVVAVVISAVYSLFLPRVYRASASIMIMPSKIQSALSPTMISLGLGKTDKGEYLASQKPSISISTHKALLKSNTVSQMVVNRLKLENKCNENLTLEGLRNKLSVGETEETNILQLAINDQDPNLAKNIVNIWAFEYTKYSLDMITGEIKGSGDFVEDQFELVTGDLVKAEKAVKDFDVSENLLLMEIKLKENCSQLETHYAKIHKLDFTLQEKKNQLTKVDTDIASMTKDGNWLGAFSVEELSQKHFDDEALSNEQKVLRQKVLKAKLNFENNQKKRDTFINDSKLMLLRAEMERKRANLVNDKTRLAQIRQLGESTKVNLSLNANLDMLKSLQRPIAENLSEFTIWEILSLTSGYNFFETREKSLSVKLEQQEKELVALENTVFTHNDILKTLDENFCRAKVDYDFYHNQLKTVKSQKNSLETEIAKIKFEFSYSVEMVKKLEGQVKIFKVEINTKKTKLTELTRQLDIAKKAYATLASKIEEARISKAMKLGEVKVVSTAFEPRNPVAPKKKLIIAFAGFVGLMLGVFMAFGLEYWQKGEEIKKVRG